MIDLSAVLGIDLCKATVPGLHVIEPVLYEID